MYKGTVNNTRMTDCASLNSVYTHNSNMMSILSSFNPSMDKYTYKHKLDGESINRNHNNSSNSNKTIKKDIILNNNNSTFISLYKKKRQYISNNDNNININYINVNENIDINGEYETTDRELSKYFKENIQTENQVTTNEDNYNNTEDSHSTTLQQPNQDGSQEIQHSVYNNLDYHSNNNSNKSNNNNQNYNNKLNNYNLKISKGQIVSEAKHINNNNINSQQNDYNNNKIASLKHIISSNSNKLYGNTIFNSNSSPEITLSPPNSAHSYNINKKVISKQISQNNGKSTNNNNLLLQSNSNNKYSLHQNGHHLDNKQILRNNSNSINSIAFNIINQQMHSNIININNNNTIDENQSMAINNANKMENIENILLNNYSNKNDKFTTEDQKYSQKLFYSKNTQLENTKNSQNENVENTQINTPPQNKENKTINLSILLPKIVNLLFLNDRTHLYSPNYGVDNTHNNFYSATSFEHGAITVDEVHDSSYLFDFRRLSIMDRFHVCVCLHLLADEVHKNPLSDGSACSCVSGPSRLSYSVCTKACVTFAIACQLFDRFMKTVKQNDSDYKPNSTRHILHFLHTSPEDLTTHAIRQINFMIALVCFAIAERFEDMRSPRYSSLIRAWDKVTSKIGFEHARFSMHHINKLLELEWKILSAICCKVSIPSPSSLVEDLLNPRYSTQKHKARGGGGRFCPLSAEAQLLLRIATIYPSISLKYKPSVQAAAAAELALKFEPPNVFNDQVSTRSSIWKTSKESCMHSMMSIILKLTKKNYMNSQNISPNIVLDDHEIFLSKWICSLNFDGQCDNFVMEITRRYESNMEMYAKKKSLIMSKLA